MAGGGVTQAAGADPPGVGPLRAPATPITSASRLDAEPPHDHRRHHRLRRFAGRLSPRPSTRLRRSGRAGRRGRRRAMPEPFVLEGRFVRLEPLSEAHIDPLVAAASEDRSNYQWTYTPRTAAPRWTRYVADALGEGGDRRTGRLRHGTQGRRRIRRSGGGLRPASTRSPTGSGPRTRSHQRGWVYPTSWTSGTPGWPASAQRSPVNTEAKLLMMGHAFEVWQVHRVAFQTDVRNARSRAAIERIGGQLDGHLAGRHARHRRHGAHLGPLLHPGGRVARR